MLNIPKLSNTANRLNSISGGLSGSYSYDAIGNALTDRSGFTYSYNHLNQPSTISKTGVSISYSYDALGNKRKSIGAIGSGITQDYVNGIEYTNGILDRIATAEGYITFTGSTPVYQYYLRDHLGNVRTVFSASGGTATVIQQQEYYPFGLRKSLAGSGVNAYLYNGKELQGELGQYDYGVRFYDPVVGRWNVVDPLAEKMMSWSPYNYGFNNPIRFIDSDGMRAGDPPGNGKSIVENIYWNLKDRATAGIVTVGSYLLHRQIPAFPVLTVDWTYDESGRFGQLVPIRGNAHVGVALGLLDIAAILPSQGPAGLLVRTPGAKSSFLTAAGDILKVEKSLLKSEKSFEKLITEHKDKLGQYVKDPDKFDNKGVLKGASPELRDRIISGRVKELQSQITKQENELQKVRNQLDEVKKLRDDQNM